MQTTIGINSPQAVKRWATGLAVDMAIASYWTKFCGSQDDAIVHEKVDLESAAGDEIRFDIVANLREAPVYGDRRALGNEESLKFNQDKVIIGQMRKPVSQGGRLSRKRTLHDMRKQTKRLAAEYCAEWKDELLFIYASGAYGANEDSLFAANNVFIDETNPVEAPDAAHILYGGDATGKADLAAADKMNLNLVERVANKTKMLKARDRDVVNMKGVNEGGKEHFILLMNPDQAYDMRTNSPSTDWLEATKNAGNRGSNNPIFTGDLGKIAGVSLHEHSRVRRFTDYGSGSDVPAARALLLGRQALTMAYGGGNKSRMFWREEEIDYGNEVSIVAGMMCGAKKTRYKSPSGNGTDFAVIAVDTAAKDPNA